jgi:hypothetical protein
MSAHIFKQSSASVNGIPVHNETQSYKLNRDGLQFVDIKNGKGTAGRLSQDEIKTLINVRNRKGPSMESCLEKLIPKTKKQKHKSKRRLRTRVRKRRPKKGTT